MIDRMEPDCLLAQRFFTAPPARTDLDVFRCDFRFPSSAARMAAFFSNPPGYQFCLGVERILIRLKNMGQEKRIDMSALDAFYLNLNHRHPNPDYHFPYTPVSYQLMTEGIKMLNAIAILLESGQVAEDLKECVLQTLGSELHVCAPGCYTEIQGAYMKLVKKPDVVLLGIKTEIAEQVAQELIEEHNSAARTRGGDITSLIYEGNHKHYIVGLLNYTANEFGFEISRDLYVPPITEFEDFIQPFRERFSAQLKGQMLVNRIVDKLNAAELIRKIAASPNKAMEYCDSFKDEMDEYGIDEVFNIKSLFNEDKIVDSKYELSSDAENYLIISILARLTKSGFINSEIASRKIAIPPHIELSYFPFHPLTFSSVFDTQTRERKPFISYCIEYFKTNNLMPTGLENPEQVAELNRAAALAIQNDDVFRLSPISLETDQDKLYYYALINAVPYSRLLAELLNMMPDDVVSSFLHYIDEAHKRCRFITSDQYNLAVQSHFETNRYFFSSETDLLALSKLVESFLDLCNVLYFVAESQRYHFLLLIGKKLITIMTKENVNLFSLLSLFREDERYRLLQHLHFSSEVIARLNLPALINMLTLIAPDRYEEVIHYMLGTERFMRMIPAMDIYLQALAAIPVNARMHFIKAAPLDYYVRLFQDNIINLGKVMSLLSVPDQIAVLSHWYPAGYQGLFTSFELLQAYLQPLQPESRAAFLCALPADLLQQWTINPLTLNNMLQLIPAHQHQLLLSHLQQQSTSVISSVTSYLGSLFGSPTQTRLSAEQREAARMQRYDYR